jgi:hypothetical protein
MATTVTPFGTTGKHLPPRGLRPPPPPWAKLATWLALVVCLGLAAGRGPLVTWALRQPVALAFTTPIHPWKPAGPPTPGTAAPNSIDRISGIAAAVVRIMLLPPGFGIIHGIGVLGLAVIGLELAAGALAFVLQHTAHQRAGTLRFRVRLPQPEHQRGATSDASADIYRALHQLLPPTRSLPGLTPWLALTLGARPDEPAELAVTIGGGSALQRASWGAAARKIIEGLAPDAVVDAHPDPLTSSIVPGGEILWTEWRPALPPSYPLRLSNDRVSGDLLGPLVAAIAPRPGVSYVEVQLMLQPLHGDAHLARGWRAAATRRLLRLRARSDYALAPDVSALETKLASPAFHATLRAVAVADVRVAAQAELSEIGAVIGQYTARSGGRLQRWVEAGGGAVRMPGSGARRSRWPGRFVTAAASITTATAAARTIEPATSLYTQLAGRWPLLATPAPLAAALPLALAMLAAAAVSLAALLASQFVRGVPAKLRVARLIRRVPRVIPLPPVLWTTAWRAPAVLTPDELSGLWHLPGRSLARLVRWLPCRVLPPPPHAFVSAGDLKEGEPPARLILGHGRHRDGTEAPVGLPLRDARQGLAFTAPPGVGKTQLASNLADQLRPCGYTLIDGKGDDAGNLVETMRRRIPFADEARLVVLDVLDSDWPVGLNPLAGVDLANPGGVDQVLGQVEAVFARLDPETWSRAPRMKNYLRKATLLVLAGEPHPTIAHVKQALLDERYRQALLPHCRNVEVVDFWTTEFPQIGEQQRVSRDALVSRFDMLLDSELTRFLFNQTTPALSFDTVIAEKLIVLAPLAHRALGGLAAPVGVLLFQALMRAAFRRPGSDLTRPEYGFIGDEFQVLVENCDTKDVRDALTQVRSFGIITIIANQLHAQLGDLADYALTAIANRVVLRTQEPDATLYARHYAASGVTVADIGGQEPREHQYAWFGVDGTLTRLFSMRPLPWQPPLVLEPPAYNGPDWRETLPASSPTPAFDRAVRRLIHEELADEAATAAALARATDEQWDWLVQRWDAVRLHQRQYILDHPGCIPDTSERQRWLSRLRAARRRVLAQAEYARVRQTIAPATRMSTTDRERPVTSKPVPGEQAARSPGSEAPTQQPYHTELNNRLPSRLTRVEPSDVPQPFEREVAERLEEAE